MKQTLKGNSNPISIGLTLFFGVIAIGLMLIRLAIEGGSPGSVWAAGLAAILAGLTVAGMIAAVRRGVFSLNCPEPSARACGRRP